MLAKQMLDFRKSLYNEGVVFCYSGYMTENVLLSVGSVIKQKLAADSVDKKVVRGVFSVFVEQVQNVIRYSIEDADPVDVWGRPTSQTLITETVCVIFRGSRDGMLRKIFNPVLETR